MYSIQQIAQIISAKLVGNSQASVQHVLIDSRQLIEPSSVLFIALVSNRNDAHQYIPQLIQRGVQAFVVNAIPEECKNNQDVCFLVVPDTLKALQTLATYHRAQFQFPVIGITGSNGKTIVKEWLYQLLKSDYHIIRSPKSYNSQIGVPLSVWQINPQHNLAIFEAGISQIGEMENLEKIIQPSIGVFTSLGSAHNEGFDDLSKKLNEKLLLFKQCQAVIINALSIDKTLYHHFPSSAFVISREKDATLQITNIHSTLHSTSIQANYQNQVVKIEVPFTDSASIENIITCWAVLLHLNIANPEINVRLQKLSPVAMRLELKLGINNCVLINDFYNSDVNALEIALHHLKQQHRGGKKMVILSDIEQSGKSREVLYQHVAKLLQQFNVDVLIGIGKDISSQKQCFKLTSFFFDTTQQFISKHQSITDLQFKDAIILLKGARSFEFELISKLLQQKSHDTVLEINLNHLVHNINYYRSKLSKDTLLMCMVKATGYGSGSTEIAFTLQHHRIDYLAVAYTDEGVELRKAGIHLPIMVMSPEESSYDDMIAYHLEPEIYSFKVAQEFIQALQNRAITNRYPIHIKLDTGMHRLGFEQHQLAELCQFLKSQTGVYVKSVFSHLAASDDSSLDDFTHQQIESFKVMSQQLEQTLNYSMIKHICNSSAITRFSQAQFNMVRLGIGMYGIGFNDTDKLQLQNISTLKTRISQIKHLNKNETVGYSRKGKLSKESRIATIPIGYADGFSRQLGNGNAVVYINEQACSTIGNICMDMCMIDVSSISCQEGDEVIIFNQVEHIFKLAEAMGTIPYEVLTSISTRVKRVYVQE